MNSFNPRLVYPGWRVLIGAFIGGALGIGFSSYIFGMFVIPVTQDLGISRSTFNNAYITYMLGNLCAGPIIGIAMDRLSIRRLMTAFGLIFGLTQVVISRTDHISLMLLMIIPLSFASTVCGVLGVNTVVARWFQARRGKALGILALSVSTGGAISQPLTAFLIESIGWRDALLMIGLLTGSILSLSAWLLVRNKPDHTVPGYDKEFTQLTADNKSTLVPERTWSIGELLRNRNFWLLALGVSLLFGTDQAVLLSQVAYFQDIGIDLTTVGLLVMVKSISAACGKLLVGFLADKVDLRYLYAYVALSAVLLLTIYCIQPGLTMLFISVALLGVTVGGVYPVWTTLMAWLFGARSYGTVMGMVSTLIPLSAILSTSFVSAVYDHSGSYVPAFITFAVLVLFSIVLIALLRPENTEEQSPIKESPQLGST